MSAVDLLVSIDVFRQVVESGSFVGAAERLNLSAAMTSKHVTHLEKHLGMRLLNRKSRSLSLTEAGTFFYERCKVILTKMEEAELAVGAMNGAPHGTLRVTCPSWADGRQMADLLAAYRRRYPEVVVDVSFEDRLVDFIEEGYDLAIRATVDQPPAGLVARRLRGMPFVIAASPEYLQRCGVPKSPEDLARHDSVMTGAEQSWHLAGPSGNVEVLGASCFALQIDRGGCSRRKRRYRSRAAAYHGDRRPRLQGRIDAGACGVSAPATHAVRDLRES